MDGPDFDHIVVGAGLSGLLLAQSLLGARQGRPDHPSGPRVLLVDPRPADDKPVTYAFWTQRPTILDRWQIGTWHELDVVGHDRRTRPLDLSRWRYCAIDWGRGRADLLEQMSADPRVTVLHERVDAVASDDRSAHVSAGGQRLSARWAYDSRPVSMADLKAELRPNGRGVVLAQAFRGVWVMTDEDVLDCSAATLLDFSADDGDDLGFSYVLPVSPRSAMVMAVRMGATSELPDPLPTIPRVVGSAAWTVRAEEQGVTPLFVPQPPRRTGQRVLAIGRRGGRVRASTGYAVLRILADTAAIQRSLDRRGHPFAIAPDPGWQRALDRIWLQALRRERADLEPAFMSLFTRASVDTVLRFLDGEARARDVVRVVGALPPRPFLRALVG